MYKRLPRTLIPRTTMRYDRARVSLDRHTTYIVATYVAGAGARSVAPLHNMGANIVNVGAHLLAFSTSSRSPISPRLTRRSITLRGARDFHFCIARLLDATRLSGVARGPVRAEAVVDQRQPQARLARLSSVEEVAARALIESRQALPAV